MTDRITWLKQRIAELTNLIETAALMTTKKYVPQKDIDAWNEELTRRKEEMAHEKNFPQKQSQNDSAD